MTISSVISVVTVQGNGATTAFDYPFLIPTAVDAVIIYTDPNGIQTTLQPGQCTITGINNPVGGVVTYPLSGSPIPTGSLLTIQRMLPVVQTTSLQAQGPTFGSIESEFDYLTMIDQQVAFELARTIRLNTTDQNPLGQLPPAALRAGAYLTFDSNGNPALTFVLGGNVPVSTAMVPVLNAASVSAALALLGAPMRQATIAALRLFSGTPPISCLLEGYTTPADGGGGYFTYVATDTTSLDNGGTIIVDAAGHRWYRESDGSNFNVEWFGAQGGTDSTAAFRLAVAALGTKGGTVHVPMTAAGFTLSGTVTIPANVSILGDPSKSLIVTAAGTYSLFSIAGSDTSIQYLSILNTAKTGGVDVSIDTGAASFNRIRLADIFSLYGYGAVADSGSGAGCYISTWIQRYQALSIRGIGFNLKRSLAFLFVDDCVATFIGSPGATNFTSFALDNTPLIGQNLPVGGSLWRGCNAEGTSTGTGSNNLQGGFLITNTAEVWMIDCDADNMDSIGYIFSNTQHIHLVNCEASACAGIGMDFVNCGYVEAASVRILGRMGAFGGTPVNTPGLAASGCSFMTWNGINVIGATGSGIVCSQQNGPINFSGGMVTGCGTVGLTISGTNGFLATGMTIAQNAGGNYTIGGATQYLQASQINNGAIVSVGPGPVSG